MLEVNWQPAFTLAYIGTALVIDELLVTRHAS
jgi:hypothetical protein